MDRLKQVKERKGKRDLKDIKGRKIRKKHVERMRHPLQTQMKGYLVSKKALISQAHEVSF
jgi:hypothetical protein